MSRALAQLTPRILTREEAAAYLGLGVSAFDMRVKAGKLPKPLPADIYGRARFDRGAIDRQLDLDSGLTDSKGIDASEALRKWRAGHGKSQNPALG